MPVQKAYFVLITIHDIFKVSFVELRVIWENLLELSLVFTASDKGVTWTTLKPSESSGSNALGTF